MVPQQFDEDGTAELEPRVVEQVDQVSGERVLVKAHTRGSLKQALREAGIAVGRDPTMVGLRTKGMSDAAKADLHKLAASTPQLKNVGRV